MSDVVDDPETPGAASSEPSSDPSVDGDSVDGGAVDEADDAPGRSRTGLIVSLVVAAVAVAFVGVLATREPATERRTDSALIGKVTPALVGDTLDGGSFDIDDHRGRWVVVNFFATWCPPCVDEHPELVAFDDAHRAAGDATVVSVVHNDRPDAVADFFADNGGEWPVLADSGLAAVDYGVVKVPETYLVAPSGVVVQKYTGGVTRSMIESDIAAIEGAASAPDGGGS